jgi:hypothetical protein
MPSPPKRLSVCAMISVGVMPPNFFVMDRPTFSFRA